VIKIYHNPRCKKSREALDYLNQRGRQVNIVKYLENKLTPEDLSALLKKINLSPLEIVRKNEVLWKTKFSKIQLNEKELLNVLSENPQLIERPIVEFNSSGVLARPLENLINCFKKVGVSNF